MKRIFFSFLLLQLLFPGVGFGQDQQSFEISGPFQHRIGINATGLLGRGLALADSASPGNPYLMTYKASFRQFGLRLGLGGHFRSDQISQPGFADSRTEESMGFDARVGLEYHPRLAKRWVGTLGADYQVFSSVDRQIDDSGFDKVTRATYHDGWGIGPVLGLEFLLNQHLSIYTEGAIYYQQSEQQNNRFFANFPEFDDQINVSNLRELKWYLPASIYLVYRF